MYMLCYLIATMSEWRVVCVPFIDGKQATIEGMEAKTVRFARKLFQKGMPPVALEVTATLLRAGYSVHWARPVSKCEMLPIVYAVQSATLVPLFKANGWRKKDGKEPKNVETLKRMVSALDGKEVKIVESDRIGWARHWAMRG